MTAINGDIYKDHALHYTGQDLLCDNNGPLSDEDVVIVTQQRDDGDCVDDCRGNRETIDEATLSTFIAQQSLDTALRMENQRIQLLSEHKLEKETMEASLLGQCQTALRDMETRVTRNGEELRNVFEKRYKDKVKEIETSLQERNAEYLEQLASQFEVQVREREDELRNELQQLHLTHIDSLTQQYDRERNELVLKMADNFNKEKEAIEEKNKEECDKLRTLLERANSTRLSQGEVAMVLVNEAMKHAQQLANERERYKHQLAEAKRASVAEMEKKQREDDKIASDCHHKEMIALAEQHDTEMARLQDHYHTKMAAMRQQHNTHQQELEVAVQNELLQVNTKLKVLEREKALVEKTDIHEQRAMEKEVL